MPKWSSRPCTIGGPDKAIPLFDGMFSLAYFDARAGALWLARDRLGIKPMSVAETAERILFASEDKAILACDGFARAIDTREITLRLAWQSRDFSYSLFEGIERLPPAGLWKITDAGIEKRCFWHVLDVLDASRIAGDTATDAEHMATLEALIQDSVGLHCIADTRLAAACSGGVDFGLVTALAKRFRPEISAYVVDPRIGHSEAEDAERTARHAGVPLNRVPIDKDRFLELWPRTIWHLESDGWHASHVCLLALAEQCRADGIKVLLTGEGADELFGGYDWQAASMRPWRPWAWPQRLFRSEGRPCPQVRAPASCPFPHIGRECPRLGPQHRAQGVVAGTEFPSDEDLRPARAGRVTQRPRLPGMLPSRHVCASAGSVEQA